MVKEEARKRWPDKIEMQEYLIKQEVESFEELSQLKPDKVVDQKSLAWIKKLASERWPKSYRMQAHYSREEIRAGHGLSRFQKPEKMDQKTFDRVFEKAADKWERWTMILFTIKEQCAAWKAVQEIKSSGGAKIQEKAAKAEKDWPFDYKMQKHLLTRSDGG